MVVVEYMPECLRDQHAAAGNSGSYPRNGAERVAVERECAERLMDSGADEDWAAITRLDPAEYVGHDTDDDGSPS